MSTVTTSPAADAGTITKADLDRAVSEATARAFKDAQARSGEILNAEDAKVLPALANHLAFDTSLSVDVAKAILSVAAKDMPKLEVAKPAVALPHATSFTQHKAQSLALAAPEGRTPTADNPVLASANRMAEQAKRTNHA